MKTAMRAKDAARLSTIRMLLAAIKQREVDERIELADADVLAIIDKMIKQRRDSIAQFEAGQAGRPGRGRARRNRASSRLPAGAAADAEIDALIADAIAATGAAGIAGDGQGRWRCVKPKLAGRADMGAVSARIKAKLAGLA